MLSSCHAVTSFWAAFIDTIPCGSLPLPVHAGKPRGYAFIEYEHKEDMKNAYKMADGRKVEGRRVLVDVERGRTVPGW